MKTLSITLLGALLLVCSQKLLARPQTPASAQKTSKTAVNKNAPSTGEQRFQANCGRRHNPPDSLSPREVKASYNICAFAPC
jgi:hypothetical protein